MIPSTQQGMGIPRRMRNTTDAGHSQIDEYGDATNIATLAAMNDGLTALKNEDMQVDP